MKKKWFYNEVIKFIFFDNCFGFLAIIFILSNDGGVNAETAVISNNFFYFTVKTILD